MFYNGQDGRTSRHTLYFFQVKLIFKEIKKSYVHHSMSFDSVYTCVTQLPRKTEYMTTSQKLSHALPSQPLSEANTVWKVFFLVQFCPFWNFPYWKHTLWPHSLPKMFLTFTMFLFTAEWYSTHESHSLVICPPVDGLLGCSQFLAIANKAAMNILYKSFYGHALPFLLGKYIGMELLGQKYVSFQKKLPDLFPKWLYYFVFPPITYKDSYITNICIVSLLVSEPFSWVCSGVLLWF